MRNGVYTEINTSVFYLQYHLVPRRSTDQTIHFSVPRITDIQIRKPAVNQKTFVFKERKDWFEDIPIATVDLTIRLVGNPTCPMPVGDHRRFQNVSLHAVFK